MSMRRKKYSRKRGKYKNGFEAKVHKEISILLGPFEYETETLKYLINETRRYTPDFKQGKQYIEAKGKWTGTDRKKMLLVIEQHPDCQFRMFFVSGNKKLNKLSTTTYGDWCDKHGIEWTDLSKGVPEKWIKRTKSLGTMSRKSQPKSSGTTQHAGTPQK